MFFVGSEVLLWQIDEYYLDFVLCFDLFSYCNCEVGFETHFGKEKGHSSLFLSPHNWQLVSQILLSMFS